MYKMMLFVFLIVSCATHKSDSIQVLDPVKVLTEIEKKSLLTPTIYYIPKFDRGDHVHCADEDKINLITIKNQLIVKSCKKVYKACEMEGTCQVEINNQSVMISVDARNNEGVRTFQRVISPYCIYGIGAATDKVRGYRHMCIDPYYSVAADLSIYNLGDVIYVPLLKGLALPNGHKHNGYVIVRDSGGLIKGPGRFDFFTGFLGLTRSNPFYKLGLGGDNIFPEYSVVRGTEADRIRASRKFPFLKLPLQKTAHK